MGGMFGGGGGGGSPPTAPKLKQVDTSVGGPLWNAATQAGQQWAQLMRQDYGFEPGGPSWRAPLGQGTLALMGQAAGQEAGMPSSQVTGALDTAGFGGGPLTMRLNPYQMAQELGQQFKNPLQQLERNQGFTTSLLQQWKPPDLTLTGEDLLNVKMGQMTQNAEAQQRAFESALQGSNLAAQAQGQASAAGLAALGKIGSAGITQAGNLLSGSLDQSSYYTPPIGAAFSGISYGAGSDVSQALGPSMESAFPSSGGSSMFGS